MTLPPLSSSQLVLSCAQMRSVDAAVTERTGLPTLILMENAGRGVAEAVWRRLGETGLGETGLGETIARPRPATVVVVCGGGNNGGDGLVVARHLCALGEGAVAVRVLMLTPPARLAGDAAVMYRALRGLSGLTVDDWSAAGDGGAWDAALAAADVIVDAVFGTGLRADVTGTAAVAIAAMNAAAPMVISVDIPSGLDGDSGRPRGIAVQAQLTVTVGARKLGLVIEPDAGVGALEVVGLGVPLQLDPALGPFCFWSDESSVRASLPVRKGGAHKGTGGHLIVVAGSPGKTGAALLSSRAALRTGAGLVTIASTTAGCRALDAKVLEAMTVSYGDDGEDLSGDGSPRASPGPFPGSSPSGADDSFERLAAICASPTVKAVALGPGIPRGPAMRRTVHRLVVELPLPMVVDADGLNLLGDGAAALLASARGARVVTPHPGEMARLCGRSTAEVQADRLDTARRFAAASRAVVVLKGARTLVVAPDGTAFVNPAVQPALATAGSGDVLTGVLGALLAQGMEPLAAARAAVFVHGRAGAIAAATYGPTGVVAGDLPEAVASVRASWSVAAAVDSR